MKGMAIVVGLLLLLACDRAWFAEQQCRPRPLGTPGCQKGDSVIPFDCFMGILDKCACWCVKDDGPKGRHVDCRC
jgi:hypothetical protein